MACPRLGSEFILSANELTSEGKSSLIFEMEGAALGSLIHNLVLKSLNWHCNKINQDSLLLDLEILIPYV